KILSGRGRNDSEATEDGNAELKMHGLVRVDDEIKNAVDSTGDFVDFAKKNLVSRADFQTIIDYAEKILDVTAEKILSGCIEVKPAKFSAEEDACKYCLYSALCTFDRAVHEILTSTLKDSEVIESMSGALRK
ncbi:MAG: hypothetical protein IJG32_06870, partial [Selenomonadaceae bacterium]|nr:hypothetical protein [Selenomonadaceae bacterium]